MPNGNIQGSRSTKKMIVVRRAWQDQSLMEDRVGSRTLHSGPLDDTVPLAVPETRLDVSVDGPLAGPPQVLATYNCTEIDVTKKLAGEGNTQNR